MNEQDLGVQIGLVIAVSLTLQTALGPAMSSVVEAIKSAGFARDGRAGLISLGIGTLLGAVAGLLACVQSPQPNLTWIGVGAIAGLVGLGAGGVRTHDHQSMMVALQKQEVAVGAGGITSGEVEAPQSTPAEKSLVELPAANAA
jgi:hypothetical protein